MEQLKRLSPLRSAASEKERALRDARLGVKDIRADMKIMSGLSHVPNFFPTPKPLVERMLLEADIDAGDRVLEPSAGKGDIALAIRHLAVNESSRNGGSIHLQCVEINLALAEHLRKKGLDVVCGDFLEYQSAGWDRVIMNPPFERGVDEKHVRHAHSLLADGGSLVAIVCSTTGHKLEDWACKRDGWVEELPQGTFARSERPTNVNTCIMKVNR